MILKSIVMDNIRSYTHEEIEFPLGISLFEGDVGSGKSTILMAIEFALFGLGSQKADALLAKKSDRGSVRLEFSVGERQYIVNRTLVRKDSSVSQHNKPWLSVDGTREPLALTELKQRILDILGFNEPTSPNASSRIFRYAVFTPQEDMKEILSDPKRRLETIRRAFGMEEYGIAKSNAEEIRREIRVMAAELKGRIGGMSSLESRISESEGIVSGIDGEMTIHEEGLAIVRGKEESAKEELAGLREEKEKKAGLESTKREKESEVQSHRRVIDSLSQDIAGLEAGLDESNAEMDKLTRIEKPDTAKSITELTAEIESLQEKENDLIRLNADRSNAEESISSIKKRLGGSADSDHVILGRNLDGLELEREKLEESAVEIREKIDGVKGRRIEKHTRRKTLELEIEEFAKLGNTCPTCKQGIGEDHHHRLVGEKRVETGTLTEKIRLLDGDILKLESESGRIQEGARSCAEKITALQGVIPDLKEYGEKTTLLQGINEEIVKLRGESGNGDALRRVGMLRDGLVNYESAAEQMEKIRAGKERDASLIERKQDEVRESKSGISQCSDTLAGIEAELESFGDIDGNIRSCEGLLESQQKEIGRVSGIMAANTQKRDDEQKKITELKDTLAESKRLNLLRKKYEQFHDWLGEYFIPATVEIEKQVLLSILQGFNETYARWYSILVEDSTKESSIDEDFTPIVSQDGYEQEIEYLSGGEKTSIALSYRLTLNSLMRDEVKSMKTNLLILDEPTDGFSKSQLVKIRDVLDELKSQQIILVSHEREMETFVDNVFAITKQNGVSKISKVS